MQRPGHAEHAGALLVDLTSLEAPAMGVIRVDDFQQGCSSHAESMLWQRGGRFVHESFLRF